MTVAYQPVDPATGLPATRLPVRALEGYFLCRRVRPVFTPKQLIELIDESRSVACPCSARFDAQLLTAEAINRQCASLYRWGTCPECGAHHEHHLQFQSNGLILSREEDGWFVWLSRVRPNLFGDVMEEHLFWYGVDWTQRDSDLAAQYDVPANVVRKWRRKLGKSKPQRNPLRAGQPGSRARR